MKLDYLYYFKRLAEVLNYTKAAQDLFISQPTLSIAMKRMEAELGFPLFVRDMHGGGISLTDSGKSFYEWISLSIKNYETGVLTARQRFGELNSKLDLGTLYAMQGRFFSKALDQFRQTYSPDLQINITQAYSADLIKMLKRGDLDVCFSSYIKGEDRLNFTLCWSQPLVMGVHKNNPLAKRASISIDEIKGLKFYTYDQKSPVSDGIDDLVNRYGLDVYRGYDDEITLSSLVSSNEGNVALFCYSFLVNAFEDVVCIPIMEVPMDFHKVYLVSRNEPHSEIVSNFIEFMGKYRFPNILEARKSGEE